MQEAGGSTGKRRRSSASEAAPLESRDQVLASWRADAWAPVQGSPSFMGCFDVPGLNLEFCDLLAPCAENPSGAFRCNLCSGALPAEFKCGL